MLNATNQANSLSNIWSYGAYTLGKTPNIPLNFIMDISYSGSDLTTGGGTSTTSQTGNYHFSQSYDTSVAGTFNQRVNYSQLASSTKSIRVSVAGVLVPPPVVKSEPL